LEIAMAVEQIRPRQMVERVHDCHHNEHSPPSVGLLFVVFLDECLKTILSIFAQPILLHFNVVHLLIPSTLHPCLVHAQVHLP
jgi:hypothetical protein